jgi:hypothetical protein
VEVETIETKRCSCLILCPNFKPCSIILEDGVQCHLEAWCNQRGGSPLPPPSLVAYPAFCRRQLVAQRAALAGCGVQLALQAGRRRHLLLEHPCQLALQALHLRRQLLGSCRRLLRCRNLRLELLPVLALCLQVLQRLRGRKKETVRTCACVAGGLFKVMSESADQQGLGARKRRPAEGA